MDHSFRVCTRDTFILKSVLATTKKWNKWIIHHHHHHHQIMDACIYLYFHKLFVSCLGFCVSKSCLYPWNLLTQLPISINATIHSKTMAAIYIPKQCFRVLSFLLPASLSLSLLPSILISFFLHWSYDLDWLILWVEWQNIKLTCTEAWLGWYSMDNLYNEVSIVGRC